MRTLFAILVAAVAVSVFMGQARSGAIRTLFEEVPVVLAPGLHLGSLALIALLVGFIVNRRGWLAASGAYLLGIALWVFIDLRPSPPWVPTDVGGTWQAVLITAAIGAPWSAVWGAAGNWAARATRRASPASST
jgi:hypothetical protein